MGAVTNQGEIAVDRLRHKGLRVVTYPGSGGRPSVAHHLLPWSSRLAFIRAHGRRSENSHSAAPDGRRSRRTPAGAIGSSAMGAARLGGHATGGAEGPDKLGLPKIGEHAPISSARVRTAARGVARIEGSLASQSERVGQFPGL